MENDKTKKDLKNPQSTAQRIKETIRNTQANPTDEYGKKLKTGKKKLDPLNGPKEYH